MIDRGLWDRIQALLGNQQQARQLNDVRGRLHEMWSLRPHNHGRRKVTQTKSSPKDDIYYRCTQPSTNGHPRVRDRLASITLQLEALKRSRDEHA